jgi:hypothetical protein
LYTVARVLNVADPDKVVNLGAKAMEARAKALSASGTLARADRPRRGSGSRRDRDVRRQSHEPALLLTPPKTARKEDDGLLTASGDAGDPRAVIDLLVAEADNAPREATPASLTRK